MVDSDHPFMKPSLKQALAGMLTGSDCNQRRALPDNQSRHAASGGLSGTTPAGITQGIFQVNADSHSSATVTLWLKYMDANQRNAVNMN